MEEDTAWRDSEPIVEDPRAGKKKLRHGVQTTDGSDLPVKSKRRRRDNASPVDYRLPEPLQHRQPSPPTDDDAYEEEQPNPDEQQEEAGGLYDTVAEEVLEDEAIHESSDDSAPIMQSLARRGESSSDEGRGRVIVSSASRKRKQQPQVSELPESLRYNGASRSENIITRGDDAYTEELYNGRSAKVHDSDSGHQSEEPELPPPLARAAPVAQRRAVKAKKARTNSNHDRIQDEVDQSRSEQAALPSFRKRRPDSIEAEEPDVLRERTSRRSYDHTGDFGEDGWPKTDPGPVAVSQEATHIVPDSQALQISPAQQQDGFELYDPHNAALPFAGEEAYNPRNARMTSAGPSMRKPNRQALGPPGARLASANIEKPLRKVQPPEPTVFKPYLAQHSPSQDTIQQFSSQDMQHQRSNSHHEAVREVIERTAPSRKRGQFPPRTASAEAKQRIAPQTADADVDMAYEEFNSAMDQYIANNNAGTDSQAVDEDLEALGIGFSSGIPPEGNAALQRETSPADLVPSTQEVARSEQAKPPADPTVVERKVSMKELGKLIKASALSADTKDELSILLEAPDYYKSSGRTHISAYLVIQADLCIIGALTSEAQWSFDLGQIPEEGVQGELILVLTMETPSWTVQEHRAAQIPEEALDGDAVSLFPG